MFLHLVKEMLDIRKKELRPFETECGLFGVGQHTRSNPCLHVQYIYTSYVVVLNIIYNIYILII